MHGGATTARPPTRTCPVPAHVRAAPAVGAVVPGAVHGHPARRVVALGRARDVDERQAVGVELLREPRDLPPQRSAALVEDELVQEHLAAFLVAQRLAHGELEVAVHGPPAVGVLAPHQPVRGPPHRQGAAAPAERVPRHHVADRGDDARAVVAEVGAVQRVVDDRPADRPERARERRLGGRPRAPVRVDEERPVRRRVHARQRVRRAGALEVDRHRRLAHAALWPRSVPLDLRHAPVQRYRRQRRFRERLEPRVGGKVDGRAYRLEPRRIDGKVDVLRALERAGEDGAQLEHAVGAGDRRAAAVVLAGRRRRVGRRRHCAVGGRQGARHRAVVGRVQGLVRRCERRGPAGSAVPPSVHLPRADGGARDGAAPGAARDGAAQHERAGRVRVVVQRAQHLLVPAQAARRVAHGRHRRRERGAGRRGAPRRRQQPRRVARVGGVGLVGLRRQARWQRRCVVAARRAGRVGAGRVHGHGGRPRADTRRGRPRRVRLGPRGRRGGGRGERCQCSGHGRGGASPASWHVRVWLFAGAGEAGC